MLRGGPRPVGDADRGLMDRLVFTVPPGTAACWRRGLRVVYGHPGSSRTPRTRRYAAHAPRPVARCCCPGYEAPQYAVLEPNICPLPALGVARCQPHWHIDDLHPAEGANRQPTPRWSSAAGSRYGAWRPYDLTTRGCSGSAGPRIAYGRWGDTASERPASRSWLTRSVTVNITALPRTLPSTSRQYAMIDAFRHLGP